MAAASCSDWSMLSSQPLIETRRTRGARAAHGRARRGTRGGRGRANRLGRPRPAWPTVTHAAGHSNEDGAVLVERRVAPAFAPSHRVARRFGIRHGVILAEQRRERSAEPPGGVDQSDDVGRPGSARHHLAGRGIELELTDWVGGVAGRSCATSRVRCAARFPTSSQCRWSRSFLCLLSSVNDVDCGGRYWEYQ